ncbi:MULTISPECIES: competence type IV pilus ATPase ComGA [unclassified Oceanobacillus]|uniref:competence type IV pilus ATPase ComGA n=1 Tax=unclassified Oceanobacillus TaxID=2630292 RepID=UPI001BE8D645|nr:MULTISPECIES: competence type IV pilus ATPase ComGA [unclassified Oceanobacillus]MBT2598340.1 Flp pilus assembly complex ATPase component TadA [Oceanobacillus sp. ISL-74]MBT2651258.1 Flp pilus assembly complex ATPase component TadA [Oceanobacillus sp. ISL-73]
MNEVKKLSDSLIQSAVSLQSSDIHFYPYTTQTEIYFRIHGRRTLHRKISSNQYRLLITYYKFISGMDIGESRIPQHGTIIWTETSDTYSLRISTPPHYLLESIAIRIHPQQSHQLEQQLFLFPNQIRHIKKEWLSNQAGIILLTGPTGSGKSTTLYALLESILAENPCQTITLEDPIEKKMDNVLQIQINEKAGISYHAGLKAALRHDPDIIMVGEIRDRKTAHFAFEAALTGHLVFSTLHAKNAVGTIFRLKEMGLKDIDLEQSLLAIGAIQLLPIQYRGEQRRAAIMELLEGEQLSEVIYNQRSHLEYRFTFEYLRKKAFAYGFISKKDYPVT